jgi:membrane protease YdiL (CAAX protease family)
MDVGTALKALVACAFGLLGSLCVGYACMALGVDLTGLMANFALEMGSILLLVPGLVILGASSMLVPSTEDLRDTLRLTWPALAVGAALGLAELTVGVIGGRPIAPDWPLFAMGTVLTTASIGLAEELVFRGLVFGALLALIGGTRRGTKEALVISALMFGISHVNVSADFSEPAYALQAVLKITQTGLIAALLCAVVLRTHKLVGVAVFHALSDLVLMIPEVAIFGEGLQTGYVRPGTEAMGNIAVYAITILLYLPIVVRALRSLSEEELRWHGLLAEHAADLRERRAAPPAPPEELLAEEGADQKARATTTSLVLRAPLNPVGPPPPFME